MSSRGSGSLLEACSGYSRPQRLPGTALASTPNFLLARARAQADDAEAYAEIAAEFASLAAAEAEAAMVEARDARARAISMEKVS